jgi:hypothetical protein
VKFTADRGAHWWQTDFPGGVNAVSDEEGLLRAVAYGDETSTGTLAVGGDHRGGVAVAFNDDLVDVGGVEVLEAEIVDYEDVDPEEFAGRCAKVIAAR